MDSLLALLLVGVTGALILLGVTLFAVNHWLLRSRDGEQRSLAEAVRALLAGDPTQEAAYLRKFLVIYALAIWLGFLGFVFYAFRQGG